MANQYDVLGKAPGLEELNQLSPNDVHLTIRGLNAGNRKIEEALVNTISPNRHTPSLGRAAEP